MSDDDLVREGLAAYRAKTRRLLGVSEQPTPEPATQPEPAAPETTAATPGRMSAGPRDAAHPPADFVRAVVSRARHRHRY